MNTILEQLKNKGCDIDAALSRTLNDEDFLISCMTLAIDDQTFERLGTFISQKDVSNAFNDVHSLKGVCANVGLSPLYEVSSEMTEILRADSLDGLEPLYAQLMEMREDYRNIIKGA